MAKMTKTQVKRAYSAILSKAQKLYMATTPMGSSVLLSTTDMIAITKIIQKYQKKMK